MIHAVPKPAPREKKPRKYLPRPTHRIANESAKHREKRLSAPPKPRKPLPRSNIAKVGKRESRNREYYSSAEWREKKRLTHERDGFQCVEMVEVPSEFCPLAPAPHRWTARCPNRGEIVNGKQTARGLVCEETSYGHRGVPGRIDTCKTRCKSCDRQKTPLERANWAQPRRKP